MSALPQWRKQKTEKVTIFHPFSFTILPLSFREALNRSTTRFPQVVNYPTLHFLWKLSNKAYFCGNFPTKRIFVEVFQKSNFSDIFQKRYFLWKFSNKANCCGNFLTKQIVVEIFPQIDLFLKFLEKWIFCGNFQTLQFFVEVFSQFDFLWNFFLILNKANCYVSFPKKQMVVEIRKAANLCEYFPTKQIIGKTFPTRVFSSFFFQPIKVLWKCSNKATFCGNFSTKQSFVEIFHKGNFYCGNLPKRHFLVETSHKGNFLCDKTAWILMKISAKSNKLPKFPRSNAATLQGFLWLWLQLSLSFKHFPHMWHLACKLPKQNVQDMFYIIVIILYMILTTDTIKSLAGKVLKFKNHSPLYVGE